MGLLVSPASDNTGATSCADCSMAVFMCVSMMHIARQAPPAAQLHLPLFYHGADMCVCAHASVQRLRLSLQRRRRSLQQRRWRMWR